MSANKIQGANELASLQSALSLRAQRQQLIASNIANADTPNFKARDVDFKSAFETAVGKRASASMDGMARTNERHLGGTGGASGGLAAKAQYRTGSQGNLDGNTVDIEVERAAFAENAVQYEATLTFVNHHFRQLTQATNGQ